MRILGISAFYHDSAAALVDGGRIVAAAQEERFTRRKHDAGYPRNAVAACLAQAGASLADIDHVVFYDKPFLKFERLLETSVAFAPRGLRAFAAAPARHPGATSRRAISCAAAWAPAASSTTHAAPAAAAAWALAAWWPSIDDGRGM